MQEIKPFIQNCSLADIEKALHYDSGDRGVLIQIVDNDMDFPKPKHHFELIYQFKFLDIEEDNELAISDFQAKEIAGILKYALQARRNVIVHCVAGVCRSGAVIQAGVDIGFLDTETFRIPNLRVKQKLHNFLF